MVESLCSLSVFSADDVASLYSWGCNALDIEMEKRIARAFIYKNKRDRFLFEMSKNDTDTFGKLPKARFNAICKLENMIDKSCCIMQSTKNPSPVELIEIMSANGVEKMCYVLSEYIDFDGIYVRLDLAVDKLQWNGFPSLIVGLPSGFSHFKGESYASTQPNCFLQPLEKFDK